MLRANKEAVMTVLDTLNFVAFNPLQNNNPIAVRRRKLMAKIDEQIQLATNKDYTPTQHKWVTEDEPYPTLLEVHKGVNEERQEQWCEENGHDWFEYKGKYPKGVIISKSAFDRQFNKYKFVALNEILREKLTHKPHKIILSEKQRKQIHKYWDKIDFPEVVEYLDKDIFK